MSNERPYVICISGFDPSGGAGILADIKTLEMHRVQGLGVSTALTFQNENSFTGMEWVNEAAVMQQLDSLLTIYQPRAVKIGIIENWALLEKIIRKLKATAPEAVVVWDPVLKASAGFGFHASSDHEKFDALLEKISLLTPNLPESEILFGTTNPEKIAEKAGCPVLLKGGHTTGEVVSDILIDKNGITRFQHPRINGYSKHGTGCILSSAIAAGLANGLSLPEACENGAAYIQKILTSNTTRLAYHYE